MRFNDIYVKSYVCINNSQVDEVIVHHIAPTVHLLQHAPNVFLRLEIRKKLGSKVGPEHLSIIHG